MSKITLLGLICSFYHYEVLAREPCVQCMDSNQKGVCLSDDSWTPTDAFTPGKRYDCLFFGGVVHCLARDQDSDTVCSSTECGFKLDMFTQGTKCFIDMHDGITAHTTIAPSGGNEAQKGVTCETAGTGEKYTGTWYIWLIGMVIGIVIAIAICGCVLFNLFKKGHIEWKSKQGPLSDKTKNENTSHPSTYELTMNPLVRSDNEKYW